MLGSLSDAEDMVQETFLRWEGLDYKTIRKPAAYLTTIVSRLCLDQLKSARVQREQYIGPWLPEPLTTGKGHRPDHYSELTDDLSIAFLHTLEQLTPVQRAVFLLHDVFGYSFKEIAPILNRTPATCRKTAQRARHSLQKERPLPHHSNSKNLKKIEQFIDALEQRDVKQIEEMLARDAILYSDGGGKASAAPKPIYGAKQIRKFINSVSNNLTPNYKLQETHINNCPGLVVLHNEVPAYVWTFSIDHGRIDRIYVMANPDKLQNVSPGSKDS